MTRTKPKGNSSDRVRAWAGPAILTYAYMPFFLLAGAWACLVMVIWIAALMGWISLRSEFDAVSWHAHELLFGFLPAVLAGFLLTTVPNWTGRLPIIGWPLAGLAGLWVVGRITVAVSAGFSPALVAVLDLSFLVILAALLVREIFTGRNWRNLPVLALLCLLILANGLFHINAAQGGYAAGGFGFRIGLAVVVMLVSLVGGRIVPSFTRNWLVKRKIDGLPAPFGLVDRVSLLLTLIALIGWIALLDHVLLPALCGLAGIANLIRLSRWSGFKTASDPLVWILHIGYLFVPLGFLAFAVSIFDASLSPMIGAQHVWMAGVTGVMPVAVMTRASLGHAGRPLTATRPVTVIYCLIIASVGLRFAAAFDAAPEGVLHVSALCWIAGFAGFCIHYWPIMTKRSR